LTARGLSDWGTSDGDLREARKTVFLCRAAEDTLKTLKHFVEGIYDVEHVKWTLEQKGTFCKCHKAVELRHELRRVRRGR
jgi:hypothetical protein